MKKLIFCLIATALSPAISESVCGQGSGFGGGAGVGHNTQVAPAFSKDNTYHDANTIVVSGAAKIAVDPEKLRLVFAVTSEGDSAQQCGEEVSRQIAEIRAALEPLGLSGDEVVEDFIVVKPKFKWEIVRSKDKKTVQYAKEQPDGFRMQTNLHVLCPDESAALKTIDVAFTSGVSEIISFDYWHSDLDSFKQQALKQALDAAQAKSEVLLSVFDEKPQLLDISNELGVRSPASLYKTINPQLKDPSNNYQGLWDGGSYVSGNIYRVYGFHPSSTFFAGDLNYADTGPAAAPMNPTISVYSNVIMTYRSPGGKDELEIRRLSAMNQKDSD